MIRCYGMPLHAQFENCEEGAAGAADNFGIWTEQGDQHATKFVARDNINKYSMLDKCSIPIQRRFSGNCPWSNRDNCRALLYPPPVPGTRSIRIPANRYAPRPADRFRTVKQIRRSRADDMVFPGPLPGELPRWPVPSNQSSSIL